MNQGFRVHSAQNRKAAAAETGRFACKFVKRMVWNTIKLTYNVFKAAGGTLGGIMGAGIGCAGGAVYKGVRALHHKPAKSLVDYTIRSAQTGYKVGSILGAGTAIVGGIAAAPYVGLGIATTVLLSGIDAAVMSVPVYHELKNEGESKFGQGLLMGIGLPNKFIDTVEKKFLNYRHGVARCESPQTDSEMEIEEKSLGEGMFRKPDSQIERKVPKFQELYSS